MLKRPLVPAAILFITGIFLAAYSVNLITTLLLCIFLFVFLFCKTRKLLFPIIGVLLILAGLGRMTLAENRQDKITAAYDGKKQPMKLTVLTFSDKNSATAYFEENGTRYKVLLRYESNTDLSPGDIVEGEITLNAPFESKVTFPGYAQSLAGNNVFLVANAEKISLTDVESGLAGFIRTLRSKIDTLGERFFSFDDRALFNAMVIGDKRLISDELYSSLQASGLNHIAVVSGMHLSVAIAFFMVISQVLFGKIRYRYIFVLFGSFLLMLFTGAGASVVRAFIMCTLYLTAEFFYRDSDSLTSLSFAALVMIAANPFMIFNVGFILSVLSVLGILLYHNKISTFLKRFIPHPVADVLSLSISAQMTVLPLVIYYFGFVTPYSLLSNALLVPISGVYVILGMVFIFLSPLPVISNITTFIMKLFSGSISSVSGWVKTLPSSLREISGEFILFFAIWVVLLTILYMHPIKKNKHRITAIFSVVVLAIAVIAVPDNSTHIYPIAYGAKTMTVIQSAGNDSFLVDCPNIYDAQTIENPSSPFTTVVLSGTDAGKIFKTAGNIKRIVASDRLLSNSKKASLKTRAKERNITPVFLDDFEKMQIGDTIIEFVPVANLIKSRMLKIYHKGKTYLSFQGLRGTDILEFHKSGIRFDSDYVILPYTAFGCNKAVFTGKILK